jgi:DNA-binding beta-propeller fold protein YncE
MSVYHSIPKLVFGDHNNDCLFQLSKPFSIAVEKITGNFHVADYRNMCVCVYDHEGETICTYKTGSEPLDLCITNQGNIAIALASDEVSIYDSSGLKLRTIGQSGRNLGEFDNPCGVTTDNDGLLYVCDYRNGRIQALDQSGLLVGSFTPIGPGALHGPVSLAVNPYTRDIYVADMSSVQKQINIYTRNGQYKTCIQETDIHGIYDFTPLNVTFSADGLLCISDVSNHCIHVLKDGVYLQSLGEYGIEPGQFDTPRGVAFTETHDIAVCDDHNHRIQIFPRI